MREMGGAAKPVLKLRARRCRYRRGDLGRQVVGVTEKW